MPIIYQSANDDWVVFDGSDKTNYGTDQAAAEAAYRRSQIMTAIKTYQTQIAEIKSIARQLVPAVSSAATVYAVNGIATTIANTASGEFVGDSTLTKEAAELYSTALNEFATWLNTPLADANGLTPIQVLAYIGS